MCIDQSIADTSHHMPATRKAERPRAKARGLRGTPRSAPLTKLLPSSQSVKQCSTATLSAAYVILCTKTAVHARQGFAHALPPNQQSTRNRARTGPCQHSSHAWTARPRLARKIAVLSKSHQHRSRPHSTPVMYKLAATGSYHHFQKSAHRHRHPKSSSPTGSEATRGTPVAAAPDGLIYTDK